MKTILTGCEGMLGRDLARSLERDGYPVLGLNHSDLDLSKSHSIYPTLEKLRPDLVINCAAYTAVDKAETEPDRALAANAIGVAELAIACGRLDAPLVHVSTDYVFDGTIRRPYRETDRANPLNVYGLSKFKGEEAIRDRLSDFLIVRTSWLYGVYGVNFVKTIIRLAREREELRVVDDQYGCPTSTSDLAGALVRLVRRIDVDRKSVEWGTYHFCSTGIATWFGFAEAIVDHARRREDLKVLRLTPITTSDYPTPAKRPKWSVLDCGKIQDVFGITARPWTEELPLMVEQLYREDCRGSTGRPARTGRSSKH